MLCNSSLVTDSIIYLYDRDNSLVMHCYIPCTIYHQGFFHSVRRNPSLNCFYSGYSWPRRTQVADTVVSPDCCRSSLPSCLLSLCPLCHSFCPSDFFESRNVSRSSMYSLLDNAYDIIYTCLMSYPGITFVVA